jgi:phenylacetate-CoA ligase
MLKLIRQAIYCQKYPNLAQRSASLLMTQAPEVACKQLELLNSAWASASKSIPFYANMAQRIGKAGGFNSLDEYIELIPVMMKSDISDIKARAAVNYDVMRFTGGSTGKPLSIPLWTIEDAHVRDATLIGRFWNGIVPGSSACLIWGHSHLLGAGFKGWCNAQVRWLKDQALGYTRISAYDLSDDALERMSQSLSTLQFDYVIGYSRALDILARYKLSRCHRWLGGKKTVIATAEALPFEDSRRVIETAFEAPLAMEYGAVETGPIAYTVNGNGYRVLWWKYFIECMNTPGSEGEILVTSLYPRAMPLFRYAIGDRLGWVTRQLNSGLGVLSFDTLIGRSNTPVIMPSGRKLHSEAVSHVFRLFPSVGQYQLECHADYIIGKYVAAVDLSQQDIVQIKDMCTKIDPEFGEVFRLERCRIEDLTQAQSGKIPFVTYRDGLQP